MSPKCMVKKRIFLISASQEKHRFTISEDESKRKVALEILLLNLKSLEDDSLNTNKSLEGEWYKYDGALLCSLSMAFFNFWKKSNICA